MMSLLQRRCLWSLWCLLRRLPLSLLQRLQRRLLSLWCLLRRLSLSLLQRLQRRL